VIGGEADTVVGEAEADGATLQVTGGCPFDGLGDGAVHPLHGAGQQAVGAGDGTAFEGGHPLILIDADDPSALLGGGLDGATAGLPGRGEDDVCSLGYQLAARVGAGLLVGERLGVGIQDLALGVGVLQPVLEAAVELADRRHILSADETDDAFLGDEACKGAGQISGLILGEKEAGDVLAFLLWLVVRDDEVDVRVTHGEALYLRARTGADGDEEVAAFVDSLAQVVGEVVGRFALDDCGLEIQGLGGLHQPFVGILGECAVVDLADVRDQSDLQLIRRPLHGHPPFDLPSRPPSAGRSVRAWPHPRAKRPRSLLGT